MDSTEIPVYGEQEQSAYNGHFESTCYHPLLLFNREGDCLAAKLRPGNVHSAEGWEELLLPEIERQQRLDREVVFRADAAFAKPELYEALEEQDVKYAIRLPANDNLQRNIAELLTRPVGRPSHKPVVRFKSFLYQAASWKTVRRVVAKVEVHCGELFPRVGFIVTSLAASSRAVVRFYNKRGTAEQWIKEGKQAVAITRLSCHRFRANEVRLWLSVIAYNLGNLWRRLALATPIGRWSLTSLQQRLVKTGGRLIQHARYYWLVLAEKPSDAAVVCRHAAEDRGAAVAGGIRRAQSGADFDDDAGRRQKRVQDHSNKMHFRAWRASPDAKTGTAGNTVDQNRPKPCRGRAVWSTSRVGTESKKEIPAKTLQGGAVRPIWELESRVKTKIRVDWLGEVSHDRHAV